MNLENLDLASFNSQKKFNIEEDRYKELLLKECRYDLIIAMMQSDKYISVESLLKAFHEDAIERD